ncbi:MAG TPA: asparagine synthase-related protein [Gemmatimonadaceae bacterium]|nr:asparagine synthase-related protein [Gemmatimonadaceae bacterium]
MANFVAIVDEDAERRRRFVRKIRPALALVDGLGLDEIEAGDFAVVWAAEPRAPLSQMRSASAAAIVWGDAIPANGAHRITAQVLFDSWKPAGATCPPAFDGFYAALRFDARDGVTVGADLLGFFPIYYALHDGVLLVGTSARLFRDHPKFPPRLSPAGLIGLLLTHAPLGGRALLDGVRRLAPGHALAWRRGTDAREVRQYTIPSPQRPGDRTSQSAAEELDAVLDRTVERHLLGDHTPGLLLSGGRDSRLVAGYVRRHRDRAHALTLGKQADYEMKCATAVARTLRLTHATVDVKEAQFPAFAELQAHWEQLGTGFASVHMWGAVEAMRELPPRFFSGYHLEIRGSESMPSAFDELFAGSKNRGFQAATLRRLLRHDASSELISSLERERRAIYETSSVIAEDRPAHFFIAHDWRAHAGGVPWKLSFGSWPILPILDRGILDTIFTLPASALANRGAQDAILRRRFPHLARLPLDRNAHDTLPLLPSARQRIVHALGRFAAPLTRRFPRNLERRYYHRVYDINGPGWRAIRRLAEPHREQLSTLFNMDALAEVVPPPDARIAVRSTIADSFAPKLLIGLMIWSADYPS